MLGARSLIRPTMLPQWNHVRAVFFPHATVLNILYATVVLQSSLSLQADRIH